MINSQNPTRKAPNIQRLRIFRAGLIVIASLTTVFIIILPTAPYIGGSIQSGTVTAVDKLNYSATVVDEHGPHTVHLGCRPSDTYGGSHGSTTCKLSIGDSITYLISRDRSHAKSLQALVMQSYVLGGAVVAVALFYVFSLSKRLAQATVS